MKQKKPAGKALKKKANPIRKKPAPKPVRKPAPKPAKAVKKSAPKPAKAAASRPVKKPAPVRKPSPVKAPPKAHQKLEVYQWSAMRDNKQCDFVVAAASPQDAMEIAKTNLDSVWYFDKCNESSLRTMAMNRPGTLYARDLGSYLNHYEEVILRN